MRKGTQVDGQIGLSELFKKELSITPQFQKGQSVFFRSLDVVLAGTVESSWLCDFKDEDPYFGYDAMLFQGLHRTFWDRDIDNTAFFGEKLAEEAAHEAKKSLKKFSPYESEMSEVISLGYTRGLDGHKLTACLAKVGDTQIYEHEFYCYHFLRTYPNQKERDKAFKKLKCKIQSEAERNKANEIPAELDTLYLVNEIYASREYAEYHLKMEAQR